MPVGDEMSRGVERGAVVVDLDEVRGQAGRRPVDEHDGHAGIEPGMVTAGRAEQQPGDPPLHHAPDDIPFPARVTPGARDEHGPAVPRHLKLHRVDDFGEERIGDGLHHEPDRGVRSRPQRPGHRIGLETRSSIASLTRSRVTGATRGSSFSTREAVRRLTPAAFATSSSLAAPVTVDRSLARCAIDSIS